MDLLKEAPVRLTDAEQLRIRVRAKGTKVVCLRDRIWRLALKLVWLRSHPTENDFFFDFVKAKRRTKDTA
jgi:hypothetical protein